MSIYIENREIILNHLQYANFFLSNYINSTDRIPQILIDKSIMKSSMTSIRNSSDKMIKFIQQSKNKSQIEQIFNASNKQFVYLIDIIQIHLTSEYTIIHNEINNLDYSRFNVKFEQQKQQKILKLLEQKKKRAKAFIWRLIVAHQLILRSAKALDIPINDLDYIEIIKEISFPPEYRQAGIQILNYFGEIISHKYSGIDVSMSIQQLKNKIILIIKTPDGHKRVLEEDFYNYGKVVCGEMDAKDFLDDAQEVGKLRMKLKMATLELGYTKKLLSKEEDKNISLNNTLSMMKEIFDSKTSTINIGNVKLLQLQTQDAINHNTWKEIEMRYCYSNTGQTAIQGPNGYAHDLIFNQTYKENKCLDLSQLSEELKKLREALQSQATSPENYSEIGSIANAEIEANNGNREKVIEALSKTSKWSLGVAEKIGIGVAIAAIKTSLGL